MLTVPNRQDATRLNSNASSYQLILEPHDTRRLASLSGPFHEHIKLIEKRLGVSIHNRGNQFQIRGTASAAHMATQILEHLYEDTLSPEDLTGEDVHLLLSTWDSDDTDLSAAPQDGPSLHTRNGAVRPRGRNQQDYVENILKHDISFGVGPAGTGKTYLAVAAAVDQLEKDKIRRILLVRPAVEAGEKLGFLPGDLSEKINPYLRPLYDALYEMLGFERVGKLIERQVIEVAPLAYMRGRTLNNAFIILDEGQNTTPEQMKMFLTRLGFGSKAVITGDITQVDLPRGQESGLSHALKVLTGVNGIHITHFSSKDVVRHHLVQNIVEAYEAWDKKTAPAKSRNPRVKNDETPPPATNEADA